MTTTPDIFTNVHKGIRKALFEACIALGRAGEGDAREASARAVLARALRFVVHHGANEDDLLLPLLRERAPAVFERMTVDHERVNGAPLQALAADAATAPCTELYARLAAFTALYLEHMREEEHELEAPIRAALSVSELATFSRLAVERTAPADQAMMLGFMLPAMTEAAVEAFLGRLPPEVAQGLRPLAGLDAGSAA